MSKPDCYQCVYRANVPGDAHSSCKHPDAPNELAALLAMIGASIPTSTLKVTAEPHAIRMGWFMHPINFDPAWLISCNGFTEKPA